MRSAGAFPTPAFYRIPRRKARFWGRRRVERPVFDYPGDNGRVCGSGGSPGAGGDRTIVRCSLPGKLPKQNQGFRIHRNTPGGREELPGRPDGRTDPRFRFTDEATSKQLRIDDLRLDGQVSVDQNCTHNSILRRSLEAGSHPGFLLFTTNNS